jgi:hypothetical protein
MLNHKYDMDPHVFIILKGCIVYTAITFADVPTPLDGPSQNTRLALRSANPLSTEGAVPAENSSSKGIISPIGLDEPSSDM